MTKPLYNIGDKVFATSWRVTERHLQCPDCAGQKYLTVILGDQSVVTIPCQTCGGEGAFGARGIITVHNRVGVVEQTEITGIERNHDSFEYRTKCGIFREARLFIDEFNAKMQAAIMAREADADELAKIQKKERPTKSWAWHVTYHRRCIKEAKRQFDYHVAKLDAAKTYAKEKTDENNIA